MHESAQIQGVTLNQPTRISLLDTEMSQLTEPLHLLCLFQSILYISSQCENSLGKMNSADEIVKAITNAKTRGTKGSRQMHTLRLPHLRVCSFFLYLCFIH